MAIKQPQKQQKAGTNLTTKGASLTGNSPDETPNDSQAIDTLQILQGGHPATQVVCLQNQGSVPLSKPVSNDTTLIPPLVSERYRLIVKWVILKDTTLKSTQ